MARFHIVLLSIAALLSVTAAARPCKTLFITSYSFTVMKHPRFNPNPNSDHPDFVTIFTARSTVSQFNPRPSLFIVDRRYFPSSSGEIELPRPEHQREEQPRGSLGFGLFDAGSFRDRTKDILSVVVALLFGVGCGALTAATMYLVWSVIAGDRVEDSESDVDYDAIESPKKMGYVTVPTTDSIPSPIKA